MTDISASVWFKNKKYIIDLSIISLTGLLIFSQSLNIYFLSDNITHIQQAWNNLINTDYYYFRPVAVLTLILDKFIWGMNPAGFHLTNLLLHLLNSVLVYLLAARIFNTRFVSVSAALLFLLHPIHSMDIFWISGRTDMVCSIFYLLSLIYFIDYLKFGNKKQLIFSTVHFALALLAKEMAISLPLIITLYLFLDFHGALKQKITYALRRSGVFYITAFLFLIIKFIFNEDVLENAMHINTNPVHLAKNIAAYLGLLVIPGGHIEIAALLKENPIIFILLSSAALVLFILAIRFWWTEKFLVFSILFILITILPVTRLLMRWYLYIPSIGFVLALAFLLNKINWTRFKIKYINSVLLLSILVIYTLFLMLEQKRWVKAGELAEKVSSDIAQIIKTSNLHECQVLNLPTELEETPVLGYGFEGYMRFRLQQDFDYQENVHINVAAHVSLAGNSDIEKMSVGNISDDEYRISLDGSDSFFVFPFNPAIISQSEKIHSGMVLTDSLTVLEIEQLNKRNEAVVLKVKNLRKEQAVIYFSRGKILQN